MIDIVKKLDQETAKNIHQSVRQSNWPSSLGWWEECPRYLVLVRTDTDKLPLTDLGLQRIFDEGKKQEKLVRMELEAAGFDVINVQRDEKWKGLNISGHIDGQIKIDNSMPLLEIKSCSTNVYRSISSYQKDEDLKESKHFWIRGYYAQMQAYHLVFNEEAGIILFKDKSTGEKHQINSKLNWDYCDRMVAVVEKVNECVDDGTVNEVFPAEMCKACNRCGFAMTICFPDKDFGPGYEFLSNEEVEANLIRREEIKSIAKEYVALDKELKGHFKGRDAIVGEFIIESKEVDRKEYTVKASTYWKVSINKLGGE